MKKCDFLVPILFICFIGLIIYILGTVPSNNSSDEKKEQVYEIHYHYNDNVLVGTPFQGGFHPMHVWYQRTRDGRTVCVHRGERYDGTPDIPIGNSIVIYDPNGIFEYFNYEYIGTMPTNGDDQDIDLRLRDGRPYRIDTIFKYGEKKYSKTTYLKW